MFFIVGSLFSLLGPNTVLSTFLPSIISLFYSLNVRNQVLHAHNRTPKLFFIYFSLSCSCLLTKSFKIKIKKLLLALYGCEN